MSEQNNAAAAGSGAPEDSETIVGGLGGLRMANSFTSDSASDNGGSSSGGPSRSQSPPGDDIVGGGGGAQSAAPAPKVSPPAGGTQHPSPPTHATPTPGTDIEALAAAGGAGVPLRMPGTTISGTSLPFRSTNGLLTMQVHELTPVIRNTSGSGDDLDQHVGNIVSPEENRGPILELTIPRGGTIGNMKQLPPRPSVPVPLPGHLRPKSDSNQQQPQQQPQPQPQPRPAPQSQSAKEPPSAATADATEQPETTTAPSPTLQRTQPVMRSHSAGNLDNESLVKTVREYYANQASEGAEGLDDDLDLANTAGTTSTGDAAAAPPASGADSQEASDVALAQRRAQSEAYLQRRRKSDAKREEQARREEIAIERALASVGTASAATLQNANIPQAIQHAVEDVQGHGRSAVAAAGHFRVPQGLPPGPPPGPPIPLPTGERKAHSFDRRPPIGSGGIGGLPPPTPGSPKPNIAASSSASPGRSGLPPLPGSTGPASQHLQLGPESSVLSPIQYQPTRDQSLSDFGRVGDKEGLESIFKEGRTKGLSPKRSGQQGARVKLGGASSSSLGIFQPSQAAPQIQQSASDLPSPLLKNPIPLDQRDWSIPSIRMAHHLTSGESCTTVETYEEDLDDEDDVNVSGGGGYDFDDATLSSRGSGQVKPPSDVDMSAEDDAEDDRKPAALPSGIETANQVIIEQGMESVTHLADDDALGAADSVHAIAAPSPVFRTAAAERAGDKKRHRKNRKSDEALEWLNTIEIGGVAEAASSKFLTGTPPSPPAGAGVGMRSSPAHTATSAAVAAASLGADNVPACPSLGVQGALEPYAVNRQTSLPDNVTEKIAEDRMKS